MQKTLTMATMLSGMVALAQDGNVGINIEKPTATLNVKSRTGTDGTTTNLQLQNASDVVLVKVLDNGNVGIGNASPSAKLDVAGSVKISDGTQGTGKVLTSDASGNATWQNISQTINNNVNYSVTSLVDYNILGYIPSATATASSAPTSVSHGGKTATKWGTHTFNGHSYATFVSPVDLTWYEAYEMAKSMGGYLATFTTDIEWQNVESGLLETNRTFDTIGAWIGFVKFSWFAGEALTPDPEMKWITGEQPRHDYSTGGTSAVRKSNWFNQGAVGGDEPNNYRGTEGFVHTWSKNKGFKRTYNGYTSTHPWNDVAANERSAENLKAFIVEFQQ